MLHVPPAWVILQGFNREEREFEQEEPFPPAATPGEQGPGLWDCSALLGAHAGIPAPVLFAQSFFWEKGVSVIFALKQAAFVQHCLLHLRKITSMGIKALWTPGAFHFMWHLGRKNHISQSVPKNAPCTPGRCWDHLRLASALCFPQSL